MLFSVTYFVFVVFFFLFSFLAGQHFWNYGNHKIRKYFGKFAIYKHTHSLKRIRNYLISNSCTHWLAVCDHMYMLMFMLKHFIKVKFKCGNWKSTSQGQPEKQYTFIDAHWSVCVCVKQRQKSVRECAYGERNVRETLLSIWKILSVSWAVIYWRSSLTLYF